MTSTPSPKEPIKLFYSYSHKDEELRDELEDHLRILKHSGIISEWHDRKIIAGTEWEGEISSHLESADVILLLVSRSFVASHYAYDIEVKRAMERHEAREARVIPIILRDLNWHSALFGKLQALPTDGKAVTSDSWKTTDAAFKNISIGIEKVIEELTANP